MPDQIGAAANPDPASSSTEEMLVFAVLSKQVAYLRDKMDAADAFELLWRTSALLSWLSGLLTSSNQDGQSVDSILARERQEAISEIKEIRQKLDYLAFSEAQRQDCARQIAECVTTALARLSQTAAQDGGTFSPAELEALYVSEDQRRIHQDVVQTHIAPLDKS